MIFLNNLEGNSIDNLSNLIYCNKEKNYMGFKSITLHFENDYHKLVVRLIYENLVVFLVNFIFM